ncbi:hypothetical protein [Candidatus Halobonum tyrrellensis]|uniref:Transcription anti-termination factor n=1 Tax=Candidatus Halobonum tyrrellensis G22 TaxID=1324957 RepID=V4IXQ4_9EURY|nr:hypothetical protein [Candidatus Halobonum tyrrellensis]ESP87942.1 hypothetical protein K933_11516 [Candidatus Halobonum tyrrellensis G22]
MDGDTLLDDVRDANETPLSRLGSSKSLYALTGGEMEAGAVRAAVAAEAAAARETFEAWSADEESGDAAGLFGSVADDARGHRDSLAPDGFDADEAHAFPEFDALADLTDTAARAGGLLARLVVARSRAEQAVGFFVGDADPQSASEFRSYRDDLAARLEAAVDLLDDVCESDGEWDAARDAADAVVEAAYDDYVETLESMGVKPKNVC